MTSFLDLCGGFNIHSGCFDFALGATLWAVKCACLLGYMFVNWFFDGNKILVYFWTLSFIFAFPLVSIWVLVVATLQVVSIKAIGIAIKLTLEGTNQLIFPQTWFFMTVGAACVITQLNYLNKVCIFSHYKLFVPSASLIPSFTLFCFIFLIQMLLLSCEYSSNLSPAIRSVM